MNVVGLRERRDFRDPLDRARMAQLEKDRAALEQKAAEELAAADETFAGMLASGVGVRERLGRLDGTWRDVVFLERRSKEIL